MSCPSVVSVRILSSRTNRRRRTSRSASKSSKTTTRICARSRASRHASRRAWISPTKISRCKSRSILAVQVIPVDPTTGNLDCPTTISFSASSGFPDESAPSPAVGGRAFYHPNDALTTVELGCTDLDALGRAIVHRHHRRRDHRLGRRLRHRGRGAAVDRERSQLVGRRAAAAARRDRAGHRLRPRSGERGGTGAHRRRPDAGVGAPMMSTSRSRPPPALEVLEDGAESTTALTCRAVTPGVATARFARHPAREVVAATSADRAR